MPQAHSPPRLTAEGLASLPTGHSSSLDLFGIKDDSLLDAENLPDPDVIALEIAEDPRVALGQIEEILRDLGVGT
jgi:hypothetical protein